MPPSRISLVTTVFNAAKGVATLMESLDAQTHKPDEIIVVDAGSTDGTQEVVRAAAQRDSRVRLIVKPGANIGQGRNAGIEAATGEIILSTDSGCRLDPHWVENIVRPFTDDPEMEFVAGCYRIETHTLTEQVVGTTTMRGVLEPIDPKKFNPSCRSMAFTKELWIRAGKFPDWIKIDDTLFNLKLRRMNLRRHFAGDAIVYWRPRSSLRAVYRQFSFYASWRGHTQFDTQSVRYDLRNVGLCLVLLALGFWYAPTWGLFAIASCYFYLYSPSAKSRRVAAKLRLWRAYPLCILVHWAIILGGMSGYLKASYERWADHERYQGLTDAYLAGT